MTSHVDNIRQTLAHSLGTSQAEVKLIEANATGVPGTWYRARQRTVLFSNLLAVARQQNGQPIPGTLEWPLSDLAIRDQAEVEAGAYLVPVRVSDHPLRRVGFVPMAAVDADGHFTVGWIAGGVLIPTSPPPYIENYRVAHQKNLQAAQVQGAIVPLYPSPSFTPRLPPNYSLPVPVPEVLRFQQAVPSPLLLPTGAESIFSTLSPGTKVLLTAVGIATAAAVVKSIGAIPTRRSNRRKRSRKGRTSR